MPGSSPGGYSPVKPWLRRLIAIASVGLALLMVVLVLLIWKFDFFLGKLLVVALEQEIGAPVELGAFHIHLRENAVEIRDLKLYDPPGFREEPWLRIPEFYLAVSPTPSSSPLSTNGTVHWREVRLNLSELAMVVNSKGQTNVMELGRRTKEASIDAASVTNWESTLKFGGLDRLVLSVGKLEFIDLRNPAASQEVRFGLTNRVYTNLNSVADFQPIGVELMVRGVAGLLSRPSEGGLSQLLRQLTR